MLGIHVKYRALRISAFLLFIMGAIVSCTPPSQFNTALVHLPTPNPSAVMIAAPEIITHSPPNLTATTQVLKDAGCVYDKQYLHNWNCEGNLQLMALDCESISPDDLLAGLTPAYPVMRCSHVGREPLNKWRFYNTGCMKDFYSSYVLFKGSEFQLITEVSDLHSTFAPIESADEALGYAIVATNLVAIYRKEDDHKLRGYNFYVDKYEDTHVDETSEGYVVHLFSIPTPLCGCQIHTTYLVDILVTKDGRVQQLNATEAYSEDSCID